MALSLVLVDSSIVLIFGWECNNYGISVGQLLCYLGSLIETGHEVGKDNQGLRLWGPGSQGWIKDHGTEKESSKGGKALDILFLTVAS